MDKKVISAWADEDLYRLLKSKVREIRKAGFRDISVSSMAGSILSNLRADIEAIDPEETAREMLEGGGNADEGADAGPSEGGEASEGPEAERGEAEENHPGEDEGAGSSEENGDEVVPEE